nr:reverse transcriptase domain-containing protein [Tanacetum cinerariifolium]
MSSHNAQFAVTYTSISSNSDGPSWGIPLMNTDPMELNEYVPVCVPEPKHLEYHAPSDDDIQVEDDNEDLEEDPSEDHEPKDDDGDSEEDPNEEHEPEDEDTKEPSKGSDEIKPPCHDTRTIARAADRAEDVGYVRVNRLLGIRIDVVRGQRTAYETELQERQSAKDLAVTQMMRIHTLEARARADMVEDVDSICHDAAYAMTWGTLKKKLMDKYCPKGEIKKLEIELWNLRVKGNDVTAYTQRFQELALMCTKFLADETEKVDKYISGLLDNIHGNVMSARPKTLDETIKLANNLMDQKLRTYAERQNESQRKANDSPRNNQQQPHKKQNIARAYIAGPGEQKVYTGDLPMCTKCNTTILGNVHPSVENARGMAAKMAYVKEELMRWEGEMLARTLTLSR